MRHQLAARAGQLGRGHHGFLHALVRHQGELDLAGLDAKAIDLDLLVRAAQVGEHAVFVAAHQVAGEVPGLATGAGLGADVGAEALGAQVGATQVAVGQGFTAEQQFAHGEAFAVVVRLAQGHLHMRQGLADGGDLGPLRRVAGEVVRGDDVAFGGAVVVVQLGAGQALEQGADGRAHLQLLARADHFAQVARRLVARGVGDHLQRHVRHEEAFHAQVDQRAVQQGRIAALGVGHQHQGTARGHGGEDLLEVHVEGQRRELEGARGLAQARVRHVPVDQVAQRTLAHGHALGPAGGAGGEEHVGQVGFGRVQARSGGGGPLQRGQLAHAFAQQGQGRCLAHYGAWARVIEHGGQAFGGVRQVERHIAHVQVSGGEDVDDGFGRARGGDGDALATTHARRPPAARPFFDAGEQFAVRQRLTVGGFQGGPLGPGPRRLDEPFTQTGHAPCRWFRLSFLVHPHLVEPEPENLIQNNATRNRL